MLDKIIFYGPTGKGSSPDKIGGGEKGCQRTIALYEKLGLKVLVVEKPTLFKGKISFLKDSVFTPLLFILILIKNPQKPVHIVGFYENQLLYEFIIFFIAKILGHKTIYELRNGTMVRTIKMHSFLYRAAMKTIIEHSSVILCQGMEYVDFISRTWKAKKIIYYPNYIMSDFIHPYNEQRTD